MTQKKEKVPEIASSREGASLRGSRTPQRSRGVMKRSYRSEKEPISQDGRDFWFVVRERKGFEKSSEVSPLNFEKKEGEKVTPKERRSSGEQLF